MKLLASDFVFYLSSERFFFATPGLGSGNPSQHDFESCNWLVKFSEYNQLNFINSQKKVGFYDELEVIA